MCNEQNVIENKLKFLEYHRKAMEARRSIGFKAFLSLVGFYIIAIKGFIDLVNKVPNKLLLQWGFTAIFAILCTIFILFMIQIEIRSRSNRHNI